MSSPVNNFISSGLLSVGRSIEESLKSSVSSTAEKAAVAGKKIFSDIKRILFGAFLALCVTSIVVLIVVTAIAGLALGILAALGTFIGIPASLIGICLLARKLSKPYKLKS